MLELISSLLCIGVKGAFYFIGNVLRVESTYNYFLYRRRRAR